MNFQLDVVHLYKKKQWCKMNPMEELEKILLDKTITIYNSSP